MAALPVDTYKDPAEQLEQRHETEQSCRVCIYNRRQRPCLHPRGGDHYPHHGHVCPCFKHRER